MDEIKTAGMESQFNRFQQKLILLLLDSEALAAEDYNMHMKLLTMILLGAAIEFSLAYVCCHQKYQSVVSLPKIITVLCKTSKLIGK